MEKLARSRNHLIFLIRCRENDLIPKGLRVSLPVRLSNKTKSREIARRTSESLLRALISEIRMKKARLEREDNTYTTQLQELICEDQLMHVKTWCSEAADKEALKTKTRQMRKFDELKRRYTSGALDPKRVVKNVSNRILSEDEEKVLALGLNFAVAPKRIPFADIIAATESTARQLDPDKAKQLRMGVSEALSRARPPKSNLDKGMYRAIRTLREDTDIVILPADKGNATVVIGPHRVCVKDEPDAGRQDICQTEEGSNIQG